MNTVTKFFEIGNEKHKILFRTAEDHKLNAYQESKLVDFIVSCDFGCYSYGFGMYINSCCVYSKKYECCSVEVYRCKSGNYAVRRTTSITGDRDSVTMIKISDAVTPQRAVEMATAINVFGIEPVWQSEPIR